jgi:hypothetical protein
MRTLSAISQVPARSPRPSRWRVPFSTLRSVRTNARVGSSRRCLGPPIFAQVHAKVDPPRYYTGVTSDFGARVEAHNAGRCSHTAKHRPWSADVVLATISVRLGDSQATDRFGGLSSPGATIACRSPFPTGPLECGTHLPARRLLAGYHDDGVAAVVPLPGNRFVSSGFDAKVKIWQAPLTRFETRRSPNRFWVRIPGTATCPARSSMSRSRTSFSCSQCREASSRSGKIRS